MSVYSKILEELVQACDRYRKKNLSLDEFKEKVWSIAQSITLIEEQELRCFLQSAEAELDSIQFSVNEEDVFDATLHIIEKIEKRLS